MKVVLAVVALTLASVIPLAGQVENLDPQQRFDREWRAVLAEFPNVAGHFLAIEAVLRDAGGKPSSYTPQFYTPPYATSAFVLFGTKSYEWIGDECRIVWTLRDGRKMVLRSPIGIVDPMLCVDFKKDELFACIRDLKQALDYARDDFDGAAGAASNFERCTGAARRR